MAESRVDDLVKKREQLNKAINDLSPPEYSEYLTKIGQPLPDVKFVRVEPPRHSLDLVLVSPESERAERQAELTELWNGEGGDQEGLSSTLEFMLHHARPKWIKSKAKIPDDQEYILECLLGHVITLQIGYDRSKITSFLETMLVLNDIIEMFEDDPNGNWIQLEMDSSWVRGDDYDRIIDGAVVVTHKDTEREWRGTGEQLIAKLRQQPGWAEWFMNFDSRKEQMLKDLESFFTSQLAIRVGEAVTKFGFEVGTLIQNPSGIVSSDRFDRLTRLGSTMLRVQGRGRKSQKDPNVRDMELTKFVAHTNQLKELADFIHEFLEKPANRLRSDLTSVLDGDGDFQILLGSHDKQIVLTVALLTAERWLDKTISERRHNILTMSLTIAREIAARELGLKQEDGSPYDPETLATMYTKGGGYRWGDKPSVYPS